MVISTFNITSIWKGSVSIVDKVGEGIVGASAEEVAVHAVEIKMTTKRMKDKIHFFISKLHSGKNYLLILMYLLFNFLVNFLA